jgi:hypothetical protein
VLLSTATGVAAGLAMTMRDPPRSQRPLRCGAIDPVIIVLASTVLPVVAGVACRLSAHTATCVDPLIAFEIGMSGEAS